MRVDFFKFNFCTKKTSGFFVVDNIVWQLIWEQDFLSWTDDCLIYEFKDLKHAPAGRDWILILELQDVVYILYKNIQTNKTSSTITRAELFNYLKLYKDINFHLYVNSIEKHQVKSLLKELSFFLKSQQKITIISPSKTAKHKINKK